MSFRICLPVVLTSLLFVFSTGSARSGSAGLTADTKMDELASLMNWAVYLSRYDKPAELPRFEFVDHRFMEKHACYGRKCNVIGWYNDNNIVYIDKDYIALDSLFERSIVVHELTHYLQHVSNRYTGGCADSVMREKEAYEIQRQFFHAYGALSPIGQHEHHCRESSVTPSVQDVAGTKRR